MASPNLLHMICLQLLYNFCTTLTTFFFQTNHWIQWLILQKKVIGFVQEL
jgi:hypothetical protein